MGDRALEQEVLSMFVQQAQSVKDQIRRADTEQRRFLAHGLKGSARGIGAFAVAEICGKVEDEPTSEAGMRKLARAIDDVRDFVATINR